MAPLRRRAGPGLAALALAVLCASAASMGLRRRRTPEQINGVAITDRLQDLVPKLGICYESEPKLWDAVLLWRERAPQEALKVLATVDDLEARHMAVDIGQLHDMYDVVETNANAILAQHPGDTHALWAKAICAVGAGDAQHSAVAEAALLAASPRAAAALDGAVASVALAWDARNFPPYTPQRLPQGWSPHAAVIVVFGCLVEDDGTPSPSLRDRLQAALELAKEYPQASIIASGGAVSSKYPEAEFIRDWLVDKGVEEARISVDTAARDTVGNAMFVEQWLRERDVGNVIIDTSTYHSPRSRLILEGMLEGRGLPINFVSVGAGNSGFPEGKALDDRLTLERTASYRDAARARGFFDHCDF